jgi:hypothetical protein
VTTKEYHKRHNLRRVYGDVDAKIYKQFKELLKEQGKFMRRGFSEALEEYVERHSKPSE